LIAKDHDGFVRLFNLPVTVNPVGVNEIKDSKPGVTGVFKPEPISPPTVVDDRFT
jgi:hypothetical protein